MNIEKHLNTDVWFDYQWFYEHLVSLNYAKFAEVGVWKGHSISFLANLLKKKDNVEIYAVDLFEDSYKYSPTDTSTDASLRSQIPLIYDIYNENLRRNGVRDMITDVKGFSWDGATKFEDGSLDAVFIDADHSYESVVKDIKAWLPKVRTGGVLSGHDYHIGNTVVKAVNEMNTKVFKPKGYTLKTGRGSVWHVTIK